MNKINRKKKFIIFLFVAPKIPTKNFKFTVNIRDKKAHRTYTYYTNGWATKTGKERTKKKSNKYYTHEKFLEIEKPKQLHDKNNENDKYIYIYIYILYNNQPQIAWTTRIINGLYSAIAKPVRMVCSMFIIKVVVHFDSLTKIIWIIHVQFLHFYFFFLANMTAVFWFVFHLSLWICVESQTQFSQGHWKVTNKLVHEKIEEFSFQPSSWSNLSFC